MNHDLVPAWVHNLDNELSISVVGAKAFNLGRLKSREFKVPEALVIPTFHPDRVKFASIEMFLRDIEKFSKRLPQALPSIHGWAVRSSATIEDLEEGSMAGRFETHFIKHPHELTTAVQKVWDSGRHANIGPESMGVIVQKLVEADFGGVAFSRDPIQDSVMTVVEMCPGKASRLVDGEVTPWRTSLADKKRKLPDGFSETTLEQIDAGVQRLAMEFGYAVDVEWAVHDGVLYWLQVRPMTGTPVPRFEVPTEQCKQLKGLWVRMQHSFSPQMPLVISMNPGGYINFSQWDSQLVNQFHYIRMNPVKPMQIPETQYNAILDRWDQQEKFFTKEFDKRLSMDLSQLAPEQLWCELLERISLKRDLYEKYLDPKFFYIRKKTQKTVVEIIKTASGPDASADLILNALLSELGSITERKQQRLMALARQSTDQSEVDIRSTPQWAEFMKLYGFESASSQLFYTPTLQETPELVFEVINHLQENRPKTDAGLSSREQAKIVESQLPEKKRAVFRENLQRLRRCMKRTEDDDYVLQKGTAQVRYILLEIGRRLQELGVLKRVDDLFFFKHDELKKSLLKRLENHDEIMSALALRRKVFEKHSRLSPPAMIVNGRPMNPKPKSNDGILTGTAASAGIYSGTVVVLNDPFNCTVKTLPKDVIVVAPIITPSLAYTLIGCGAIVTEVGGFASHGAIVAREMGIPAVIGVAGARERMMTGMVVTVDGTKGEIFLS